jgi:hypothetical protein
MTLEAVREHPRIYVFDPSDFSHLLPEDPTAPANQPSSPRTPIVSLGIPTALHVCSESRAETKRALEFMEVVASPSIVEIPHREFDSERDAVFVSVGDMESFVELALLADDAGDGFFDQITSLALSPISFVDYEQRHDLLQAIRILIGLQTLHFIVEESWGDGLSEGG